MKYLSFILPLILTMTMCSSTPDGQKVLIETNQGNIKIVLYNDTPIHRDNFIKLVEENYYTDLTFHRVIKDFMIQAGDLKAKTSDSITDIFDKENTLEAEFRFPKYYHKAGALAAARWGDDENPAKASDASQFYIVTGKRVYRSEIATLEKERFEKFKQEIYRGYQSEAKDTIKAMYREGNKTGMTELKAKILETSEKEAEERKTEIMYTEDQKKVFETIGGTPHLDTNYTVFGEVIEGLDIAIKISDVKTNEKDKPNTPIVIKKISLVD